MSDLPTDWRDRIDLRAEIARIDRDAAETRKFSAEQNKLVAEASKLRWERWLLPFMPLTSLFAAALSGGLIAAVINHYWH
jgi:hypothetical protein